MAAAGRAAVRSLRALRHAPPGYAGQEARRTMFQSSLEQCEQFLAAASNTGYAPGPFSCSMPFLRLDGRSWPLRRASAIRRGESADTA